MYDVNPTPMGEELALCVSEDNPSISVELAIETASHYGMGKKEAQRISDEILLIIKENWERFAIGYGLGRGAIEQMRPAFQACYGEWDVY